MNFTDMQHIFGDLSYIGPGLVAIAILVLCWMGGPALIRKIYK